MKILNSRLYSEDDVSTFASEQGSPGFKWCKKAFFQQWCSVEETNLPICCETNQSLALKHHVDDILNCVGTNLSEKLLYWSIYHSAASQHSHIREDMQAVMKFITTIQYHTI